MMAIQTQQLIDSLPNFAALFRSADAKGACDWKIVRWQQIDPKQVTPDMVSPVDAAESGLALQSNQFASRTQALRYSKAFIKAARPNATEKDHWGVWMWIEDGRTCYQTVIPATGAAYRARDGAVREPAPEGYSTLTRVSAEANRRLREIAAADRTSVQAALDAAVKEYYRQWFFERADAAYIGLDRHESRGKSETDEKASWDAVLMDGIDCDETWNDDGTVRRAEKAYERA